MCKVAACTKATCPTCCAQATLHFLCRESLNDKVGSLPIKVVAVPCGVVTCLSKAFEVGRCAVCVGDSYRPVIKNAGAICLQYPSNSLHRIFMRVWYGAQAASVKLRLSKVWRPREGSKGSGHDNNSVPAAFEGLYNIVSHTTVPVVNRYCRRSGNSFTRVANLVPLPWLVCPVVPV